MDPFLLRFYIFIGGSVCISHGHPASYNNGLVVSIPLYHICLIVSYLVCVPLMALPNLWRTGTKLGDGGIHTRSWRYFGCTSVCRWSVVSVPATINDNFHEVLTVTQSE